MSSVYTNDLRLEEIGSGEQSGTWGDTTNTNLELIAEAFSFGTEAITTNADTHTTTIADGATDPGRSIYLKYTGTLDSDCTITLGPNTVSKVWFIENATSGSQNIIISQGSGANVTIGNGAVKMVYSDGAGSGAAVVDALVDLDLTGTTTIAAANISGDLDVDGTANLDVVDIDGALTQDGGAFFNESGADVDFRVESTNSTHMLFVDASADAIGIRKNDPSFGLDVGVPMRVITADNSDTLTLTSTDTDASKGPNLVLKRDNNSGAGDDLLGTIDFIGEDAGNNLTSYVTMSTMIQDVTGGSEDGRFFLKLQSGGSSRNILDISGSNVIHFNSDGEDINFRYDSDTVANALFVDGATGYISTGTLGSHNVRLGENAGDAIESTGSSNTLIGAEAGTAITTGDNNVAVGYKALEAEDNYGYNVAVGSESLMTLAATSADAYSTAVGYQSGKLTDTGLYNTFVGAQSGRGNTSASNNVGLGNASLYTNQLGSSNVAIGVQALNTMNPSTAQETFNTAVGYQAMQDASTVIQTTAVGGKSAHELTTGNYNVAVGMEALEETTVGDYNTAIGTYALKTNVNGDRSTAFGYGALFSQGPSTATNADYQNVAMGMHAGYNISTGKKNVYIGYEAANGDGSNKATGDDNVFIGNEAGHDITTGGNNVLIGSFAGDKVTTGVYNVALGTNALGAATTDNNSTAIGQQSLGSQNTTTDSHNTGCGYLTGYYLTTGVANTFVGSMAGFGASGVALTGDANTCVGYRAGHVLQGDADDNVCIGKDAGKTIYTADNNTLVGSTAGEDLTIGEANTAVGSGALKNATVDRYSTAVGYLALNTQNATGGSVSSNYNSALGTYAGYGATTGVNNTMVGGIAGYDITSGHNNIALGYEALRSGSPGGAITTQSHTIGLGDENINSFNCQVALSVASDERDKTDFTSLDLGMNFVKALKPYTFRWDKRINYADKSNEDWRSSLDLDKLSNDGTHKEDQLDIGFKAQDVKALEEASNYKLSDKTNLTVGCSDDGKQYSMRYEKLVPILVKAIQELEARVATLEGE